VVSLFPTIFWMDCDCLSLKGTIKWKQLFFQSNPKVIVLPSPVLLGVTSGDVSQNASDIAIVYFINRILLIGKQGVLKEYSIEETVKSIENMVLCENHNNIFTLLVASQDHRFFLIQLDMLQLNSSHNQSCSLHIISEQKFHGLSFRNPLPNQLPWENLLLLSSFSSVSSSPMFLLAWNSSIGLEGFCDDVALMEYGFIELNRNFERILFPTVFEDIFHDSCVKPSHVSTSRSTIATTSCHQNDLEEPLGAVFYEIQSRSFSIHPNFSTFLSFSVSFIHDF
jgi:hypothetical protein